jgi:hypothetical protein
MSGVVRRLHPALATAVCLGLSGCIGDLPPEDFGCLIAADRYNSFNEAYVFSPRGDKKRLALAAAEDAERQCELPASAVSEPPD